MNRTVFGDRSQRIGVLPRVYTCARSYAPCVCDNVKRNQVRGVSTCPFSFRAPSFGGSSSVGIWSRNLVSSETQQTAVIFTRTEKKNLLALKDRRYCAFISRYISQTDFIDADGSDRKNVFLSFIILCLFDCCHLFRKKKKTFFSSKYLVFIGE